ncbi:hypothetical protein EDB82DRAFT_533477 [Fusarium venenatum]|uniref:uncharacterized protein n=1 Tax=Fusarium venenatum TaxID=56646 RepID=UPI001D8BACBA|nr:hypothetical protein EDB82DRAFT_533477 [Fusarium venenatum]
MSDLYTYSVSCCDCTICGIKLDEVDPYGLDDEIYAEPELWKQDNVVLSSLCCFKRPNPFSTISDDSIGCGPVFEDTNEKGTPSRVVLRLDTARFDWIEPQRPNWNSTSRDINLYFIALHAPCLHPPTPRPATGPVKLGLSRYFVDPKRVLGAVDDDDWGEDVHGPPLTDRWWNSDLEHIRDLTHSLLSNLDEYEATSNPLPSFKHHLEALPQEIKEHILQFMPYDIPLQCTYLLDQSYWCTLLWQIPFPWDLDLAMVHAKLSGDSSDGQKVAKQYDWEKPTR